MKQQRSLALKHYTSDQLSALSAEELELPTMISNFKVYGLRPPDRMRFNFSTWEKGFVARREGLFDAILTDPPYGVREPRRKVGEAEDGGGLRLSSYSTTEVVVDLLLFGAAHLRVGGFLAFWHPTTDDYSDEELPCHPSLEQVSNCPQRLSLKMVRRLVVLRKVRALPSPPPKRVDILPRKAVTDLRDLMDVTNLPNNTDYTQYRERVARRRDATARYWSTRAEDPQEEKSSGNRRGRKNTRRQTQEEIVANRERNIRMREEKQLLSEAENARLARKDVDKNT